MSAGRQWLITARDRRCHDCDAPAKVTIAADGKITWTCPKCPAVGTRQSNQYYEQRACELCHYVRRVTVYVYQDGGLSARKLCDACEAESSAASHLYTARKLQAKARAIRAKRTP